MTRARIESAPGTDRRSQRPSSSGQRHRCLELTAVDRTNHLVVDENYTKGLKSGCFIALCGGDVEPAAMITGPARQCRICWSFGRPVDCSQLRTPGFLEQLLHRHEPPAATSPQSSRPTAVSPRRRGRTSGRAGVSALISLARRPARPGKDSR